MCGEVEGVEVGCWSDGGGGGVVLLDGYWGALWLALC